MVPLHQEMRFWRGAVSRPSVLIENGLLCGLQHRPLKVLLNLWMMSCICS